MHATPDIFVLPESLKKASTTASQADLAAAGRGMLDAVLRVRAAACDAKMRRSEL